MRVVAIIPARYSSKRFPGKVVVPVAGKPMIQRVWERTGQATLIDEVVVATDDERVQDTVAGFGGKAIITSPEHRSGTERSAAASELLEAEVVVNVQGDEPLINPESLDLVVRPLNEDQSLAMATLKHPLDSYHSFMNQNVVKVVCDEQDNAIYFSRAPLPFFRDNEELMERWQKEGKRPAGLDPVPMKHIGVYAYRRDFLQAIARMPTADIEKAERLEQLRVLAWGFKLRVVSTPHDSISIDVPGDVEKVEAIIAKQERVTRNA